MAEPDPHRVLQRQALDYRNRAEELRTVGESTRSLEARRVLLDLANATDQMAAKVEERAKALPPARN